MNTVGELRQALEGVPDDCVLKGRVVAKNGSAWTLNIEFCASVPAGYNVHGGTMALLKLTHPDLETMPEWPAPE
ncbi:hypothetical protein [Candidatus Nitrotoga fabula]|uniref:Uncharacterized protein n=1 Tax=Candidatus Nitrotoga fabula TaxID=2182327 RepID=A0A2X0SHI8_9PROT|nr:hypothetical protein [Candidatus Nitrotoga fabula]CAE6716473.1 conserved hypothetical protein [Candidatus Nitrotoga fabula]SPS06881.1 protein of unknown function [Candidatus Nitrotoga fabula]